jgi:putative pyruvate formate lyase activating enzyme
MPASYPAYLELFENGELARRAQRAVASLADCELCARRCRADRLHGEGAKPYCRTGRQASVSSFFPHHGEEACLRGTHGSGTIFFSHCNLRCIFCQNFDLSWRGEGRPVEARELAEMMLRLQEYGCHNLNLVTPSHVVAQILEALLIAVEKGLRLPIVYNTGGYDRLESLELLDGVVDIYMPDLKFWDPEVSDRLCKARDYAEIACRAVREMHRQVGDLVLDERGLARRGLLVRHLVMPNDLAGTRQVMRFLANEISPNTYVNIMDHYHPEGLGSDDELLNRSVTLDQYHRALAMAHQEGIRRLDRGRGWEI